MERALFALFFLLIFFQYANAQESLATTQISLLTSSPGAELYNTFGHSAIRIYDRVRGVDYVYNYGTFDFEAPNFYLNFTRGKLDYMLSIGSMKNLIYGFKLENRLVVEQVLNLDDQQKKVLIDLLEENYQPDNRYYKYDFFFDNCATRIRDIMVQAYADDFKYHYPEEWENSELTFRNLLDLYLDDNQWSDFGIDIALGLPTDDITSPKDYMFLPDYLSEAFGKATIVRDGKEVPFTLGSKVILSKEDIEPEIFFISPIRMTWALFVIALIICIYSIRNNKKIRWFDVIYFSVIGLVGWVVFLLWFATDHIATKDNLNLLWAVPIYLPLFFYWNKISGFIKKWIILILGAINLLLLLFWSVFPQNYHMAFIPLILIIIMRFFFLYRELKSDS